MVPDKGTLPSSFPLSPRSDPVANAGIVFLGEKIHMPPRSPFILLFIVVCPRAGSHDQLILLTVTFPLLVGFPPTRGQPSPSPSPTDSSAPFPPRRSSQSSPFASLIPKRSFFSFPPLSTIVDRYVFLIEWTPDSRGQPPGPPFSCSRPSLLKISAWSWASICSCW